MEDKLGTGGGPGGLGQGQRRQGHIARRTGGMGAAQAGRQPEHGHAEQVGGVACSCGSGTVRETA